MFMALLNCTVFMAQQLVWDFSIHSQSLSYIHPLSSYLRNISWERHHKELPVWRDLEAKTKNKSTMVTWYVFFINRTMLLNRTSWLYATPAAFSFLLQHIFWSWRLSNQEQCQLFRVQWYYTYPKPILILNKDAQNTMPLAECMG